jgi:hypothetical protein
LTIVIRLILDTLVCRLDPCRVFLAHLPVAVSGDGFEQFAADPELEQVFAHVDVAAGAGVVLADADLLPGHADHAVAADLAGDPVLAGPVG